MPLDTDCHTYHVRRKDSEQALLAVAQLSTAVKERQRLQHCLKHSLNNLFQRDAYSVSDLEDICTRLCPHSTTLFNPHRTFLLGNYDVNVLEVALAQQGKALSWYDIRDSQFTKLDLDTCWALILNVRAAGLLARLLGGRHWFGLKCLQGRWYNLDSNLRAPQPMDLEGVGGAEAVRRYLSQQVEHHDAKVFVVTGGSDELQQQQQPPLPMDESIEQQQKQTLAG